MNLLNKLTIKNLNLNKKRTIVTIIGIILSVALITAVAAMFFSARDSIIKYETKVKGNYHYSFKNVPESDIKYFTESRNFEAIYFTKSIGYAKIDEIKNEYKPYVFIMAFDNKALDNLAINLVSGRLPQKDNEILIPTHLKTNGRVEYKIGDTLTLNVGRRVSKEDEYELDQGNPFNPEFPEELLDTELKEYKVVGIIERPTSVVEDYKAPGYTLVTKMDNKVTGKIDAYTRYTKDALKDECNITAEILSVDKEAYNYLYCRTNERAYEYDEEELNRMLEKLGEYKYDFNKNAYLIMLETGIFKGSSMQELGTVAMVVVIIIIFTSVFCIKNSFNISITEKIKQYGMLSTVGATSKQIKRNVYYEALMLGVVGIPLGILCGLLASYILIILSNFLIGEALNIDLIYSFSWLAIAFAIILGLVTIYLSAWGSARIASKVTPITAIRNSEDIKINPKKIKSPKYIKKIFGVGGDVSYKNLKRNKKKYRATVISIVVCVSVFIALASFINLAFDEVQREIETTDYNIQFTYQSKEDIRNKAHEVVNFDYINDYSIFSSESIYETNNNVKFTKEYLEYFPHTNQSFTYTDEDGQEITDYSKTDIHVYRVGQHAYEKYLKKLGLKESEVKDKGILIKNVKEWIPNKKGRTELKDVQMLDYKKGDVIKFKKDIVKDEKETTVAENIEIEVAYVAEEVPFGIKTNSSYAQTMIVSDEYFNKIFKDISYYDDTETISIDSTDATKLQDQIEEYLSDFDDDYMLVNTEESVKQIRSFYILVAIFLYGFITVIALIGITNIFNTITTNMELRSREFATLKSVGMTRKEFNRMIRLESFFYGIKSLIIGIPIGCLLSILIHNLLMEGIPAIAYKLPLNAIIISVLAVFILITCIMKYSINKINKQNTIETIRNENI